MREWRVERAGGALKIFQRSPPSAFVLLASRRCLSGSWGEVRGEEERQMVSEMPELLLLTFFCLLNCHGRIRGWEWEGGATKNSTCSENGSSLTLMGRLSVGMEHLI